MKCPVRSTKKEVSTITRIKSHVLEWVIGGLMTLFGLAAVYIFAKAASTGLANNRDAAIIEILLIIVLAILAQTGILIRIYEQNNR